MKNRSVIKLIAILSLFMALCLVSTALYAEESGESEGTTTDDGRKMSREAQVALVEAQRRMTTEPENYASAREPLIEFLATPQVDPIPETLYLMLGQLWYIDETNPKHIEEARKVYKEANAAFPTNDGFLLNYAVTTYQLDMFAEAAVLFEKYYEVDEKHDIQTLENAAQLYASVEDMKNAKRLYVKLLGLVEMPDETMSTRVQTWLQNLIGICQMQEDAKEADKYIRMALDYFPMEKKYWKYLAGSSLEKEDYKGGAAAYEIATRVKLPEDKSEWRVLIDLYNYLGLPLRSAEGIQKGLDLLAAESTEKEQQLAIVEAYVRGARVDKAVAYLDSIIAKNPDYDFKLKKATILYDARKNEAALAALDDCIDADARAYDAYYMKGWVAWDMKDWKAAEAAFEKSSSSKNDIIRLNSKDALEMLNDLDEARAK